MLAHPFIKLPPPKSTDPEEFADLLNHTLERASQLGLSDADIIATITAFTAITIANACKRFWTGVTPINEVLVSGGGRRNCTLMRMLRERIPFATVRTTDEFGLDGDAKEAIAFAVLAHLTLIGVAGNIPNVTGALHPVVLGKLVPPALHT